MYSFEENLAELKKSVTSKNPWLASAINQLERMPQEARDLRDLAINDLWTFANLVNPGYMYGDIHKKLYKWLEDYTLYGQGDGLSANKLVMLPRAHLKSHMVATWAAWITTRHPEITILYVSATAGLAEAQLFAIQNILASSVYQRYFPEFVNPQEGKREKWSSKKFSIDHPRRRAEGVRDATLSTAGLTTNTTGWHADVIVADDLVVPENAYTEDGRLLVRNKSSQFTSIRNAGGFTLACGTRYHPNDIYAVWKDQSYEVYDEEDNVIERKKVWEIEEYPVETDGVFLWNRTMRPSDGKFFGFDRQTLARIEAEYEDRTQFFAQYYNDPNDPGSNRINVNCFQYYDQRHLRQSYGNWYFKEDRLNVYASIDFAFSLGKRSDSTAIVVIGINPDGHIYILDIDMFKSDKILEYFNRLSALQSRWGFKKLRAEVTVAQAVIVRDLKDRFREEGIPVSIEEYRPSRSEGNKQERMAAALEHRYEGLTMWHYRGGFTAVLEEQLIQARPRNDDIKDALASVVEMAVRPRRTVESISSQNNGYQNFNSRFGGVAFR